MHPRFPFPAPLFNFHLRPSRPALTSARRLDSRAQLPLPVQKLQRVGDICAPATCSESIACVRPVQPPDHHLLFPLLANPPDLIHIVLSTRLGNRAEVLAVRPQAFRDYRLPLGCSKLSAKGRLEKPFYLPSHPSHLSFVMKVVPLPLASIVVTGFWGLLSSGKLIAKSRVLFFFSFHFSLPDPRGTKYSRKENGRI
jgi:hypothetical protein